MTLGYSATKRSPEKHQFAFGFSSLPSEDDDVIEGNDDTGVLDGNE